MERVANSSNQRLTRKRERESAVECRGRVQIRRTFLP